MRSITGPAGVRGALAGVLLGVLAGAAHAGDLASEYTDLDLGQCTLVASDELGASWACPGLRGYPVMVAEGDLRMFVSFGLGAGDEKAAGETLPPFNRLGAKLEWLTPEGMENPAPVATILRWFTQREGGEKEGQVLVVTQTVPGATCHIAYVDALANRNANQLARDAAEELAGDFDCEGSMPRIYGEFAAFDLE